MTPADALTLSQMDLWLYFDRLRAGPDPPLGIYDGHAWSHDYPRLASWANKVWRGKVFDQFGGVLNRIGGQPLVPGTLRRVGEECYLIQYPRWGLEDELRWGGWYWLGRMELRNGPLWFTLVPTSPL